MDQKGDLKMKSTELCNHLEKLWQQQLIGEISSLLYLYGRLVV